MKRILAGSLTVAVVLFILFQSSTVRNSFAAHPDAVGPTIYSKSAIGHAAWFRLLRDLEMPVSGREGGSGAYLGPGNVLVIAEPRTDPGTLAEVRAMLTTGDILLVLPKRRGTPDRHRPDWIGEAHLLPESEVNSVLHLVDPNAAILRVRQVVSWESSGVDAGTPSLPTPQLMVSRRIVPLLAAPSGTLIGEVRFRTRRIIVLADPDLIANHGLRLGDNSSIAVNLIDALRAGREGNIVFDEFIHGYTSHPFHMLGILFQFPFVLVTLQMVIAIAVLAWTGTARLGMPLPAEPGIEAGKRSLIEAGAGLLDHKQRLSTLTERYCHAMVQDVGRRMHAPRGLDVPSLLAWLVQAGKPKPNLVPDPSGVLGLGAAQNTYTWRKEILGGS